MEDKNELNDILIKNSDKEKANNVKNILLFAAVTLLVFFIGILAFKMISQDEMQKQESSVLPEEPTSVVENSFEKEPVTGATAEEEFPPETAAAAKEARPTGGVTSAMMPK